MNTFRAFLILIIGLAVFSVFVFQASAQQLASTGNVIVEDTGSTNFSGYRIAIEPSGQVNVMGNGKEKRNLVYSYGQYNVSPETVKQLINDLEAVMPLSGVTPVFCMKSVSFGTITRIIYKGQTSPDIQCMKNAQFVKDVYVIMGKIPRK